MWKNKDTVVYFKPDKFQFFPNVVIFNFYETLIFSYKITNKNMKLKYKNVCDKLLDLHNQHVSIIIYQSSNNNNIEPIFNKFNEIIFEKIGIKIPIFAFFSNTRDKYSKPFTGMWKLINNIYTENNHNINVEKSIVIGHESGEVPTRINRSSIKYKCDDRAFAHNINMTFIRPETFFLNSHMPVSWRWNDITPSNYQLKKLCSKNQTPPILLDEIKLLPNADKYTIIITGNRTCGKTLLSHKLKKKWDSDFIDICKDKNYEKQYPIHVISDDDDLYSHKKITNAKKKCLDDVKKHLEQNKSIIVDTLYDYSHIMKIVKLSMKTETPILIIYIEFIEKINTLFRYMKTQTNNIKLQTYYLKTNVNNTIKVDMEMYTTIPCVRCLLYPLIINQSEDLWFEYC
jgi:DNA 3'-phosphatase